MRPLLCALCCLVACAPEGEVPLHDTAGEATILAEQARARWPAEELALDWQQTVLAYGFSRLHAATGQGQDYYRTWLDAHRDGWEGRSFVSSDGMSPSILAAALSIEDPGFELEAMLEVADRYLLQEAPRTANGAIVHWSPGHLFGDRPQVWIDSQFMFGVYLLHRSLQTGDRDLLELWGAQYDAFSALCRDATDLYRHAWDEQDGANIPVDPVFWARGNSWVLISAAEATRLFPDDPIVTARLPALRDHAEALAAAQADDGLWRTVLLPFGGDDPANYTETSGAALIGYGLHVGVTSGALDAARFAPVVTAAVDGVLGRIEIDDGHHALTGTSFGTNPGDYEYYLSIPRVDDLLTGVGAAILLLAEVDGDPR